MATRTAQYVISDAFHRIAVISEDEAPTAEQITRGLNVLNDMLNGFEAEGIQYAHTDLVLSATVNVPDFLVRSVTWMLVKDLADEYGKTLTPGQTTEYLGARGNLQAYYFRVPAAQTDEGIVNRRQFSGTLTTTSPV